MEAEGTKAFILQFGSLDAETSTFHKAASCFYSGCLSLARVVFQMSKKTD